MSVEDDDMIIVSHKRKSISPISIPSSQSSHLPHSLTMYSSSTDLAFTTMLATSSCTSTDKKQKNFEIEDLNDENEMIESNHEMEYKEDNIHVDTSIVIEPIDHPDCPNQEETSILHTDTRDDNDNTTESNTNDDSNDCFSDTDQSVTVDSDLMPILEQDIQSPTILSPIQINNISSPTASSNENNTSSRSVTSISSSTSTKEHPRCNTTRTANLCSASISIGSRPAYSDICKGYIFECSNDTEEECFSGLFGAPLQRLSLLQSIIQPYHTALFLYNISTHELHGCFEPISRAAKDITPHAFTKNTATSYYAATYTRFPAQIRVRWKFRFHPLPKHKFSKQICDRQVWKM